MWAVFPFLSHHLALHHLAFKLIYALYLCLGKKLRILFIILLTNVEQLLALFKALLNGLFGLFLSSVIDAFMAWPQRPYFFLTLYIGVGKASRRSRGVVCVMFFGAVCAFTLSADSVMVIAMNNIKDNFFIFIIIAK